MGNVFSHQVVIALDIGTSYTGFAYSLNGSRDSIITARHRLALTDDRVPTAVLLNPDKTFNSFGYDAQQKYTELSAEERDNYYYLEHFKLALYRSEKISRDSMIKDSRNRDVNAMSVFTMTIKYFRDIALHMAKLSATNLEENHIQWILTIPAIWTASARQFMREAAKSAGIKEDKLRLVLEPDAASLFCQEYKIPATADRIERLPVGPKYILADLGGGTADIYIHKIIEGGKLQELDRATCGDFGGNMVTEAYFEFIKELFGTDVWNKFEAENLDLYFEMLKVFERKKETFSMMDADHIIILLETTLLNMLKREMGKSLETVIQEKQYGHLVTFNEATERLIIKKEQMERFFISSVNGIIENLKQILESCQDPDIQTLMLVGGYAESPYLRERIQTEFTNLSVILHNDTRLAVLKGAVMMGYMPRNIVQRRARFTYGFCNVEKFIPGKYPESLKRTDYDDGRDWCNEIHKFAKFIEKGKLLQYGETVWNKTDNISVDPEEKHTEQHMVLLRSTMENPRSCHDEEGDDKDCERAGKIVIKPPPDGWPDCLEGEHPEPLKYTEDGKDWCKGIFFKYIEKGQLLKYGDTFILEAYHTAEDRERKHKERYTRLWRSNRENPRYCMDEEAEEDCEIVGEIVRKPPPDGWSDRWECETRLRVGEMEFTMKYINKSTGEKYETRVDFM